MNKKIEKILKNPLALFLTLAYRGAFNWMSDERYLKTAYWCKTHRKLDLKNPKSFNEKLQWLKLHDRKPEYSQMVDKYAVKDYVASLIGEEFIIPTIGVWDRFEDIDIASLPNQFVMKCTHDSGSIVICKDKKLFDIEHAKKIIEKGLGHSSYWTAREWPYKNVKPRIIVESYISENKNGELKDYKFFCFSGEVKFFKVDYDRYTSHRANYYDLNKKFLPFYEAMFPSDKNKDIEFPDNLQDMIELAKIVSKNKLFVRVDFYNCSGKIYFGEITFFPSGGFGVIEPYEWDLKIGDWIRID